MEEKITRDNIAESLFNKQLEIIGKTRIDAVESFNWRFYFTITGEQYLEFKKYAISLIQKVFKCNKTKALNTFDWYWKMFSVRFKD